jgi:hypothetical protein
MMDTLWIDCVICGRPLEEINRETMKKMKVPLVMKPILRKALKKPKYSFMLYQSIRAAVQPKCKDYGLECEKK